MRKKKKKSKGNRRAARKTGLEYGENGTFVTNASVRLVGLKSGIVPDALCSYLTPDYLRAFSTRVSGEDGHASA